ncbi:MAG: glycosyltransferase [Phycisphaerales bacterium]|nr:glycosyltransferase [Phycisphaerales bacterium]
MEELARSAHADFTFVGDDHDFLTDVKAATFTDKVRFILAPTRKMFGRYMWQWGAVRIAFDRRFDTIVFHPGPHWPCTWLGAILARLIGKRVLFWGHGYLAAPSGLKGVARRALNAIPHEHLFYGRWAKQFAMDTGWDPAKLHVIGNSLDLTKQAEQRAAVTSKELVALREKLFDDPTLPIAFCSCRLQPAKRLDMLVGALAQLRAQGVGANLLIVGEGACRKDLEEYAHRAGIDAHFTGACYDEGELARYISASDVTVSPGFVGLTAIHSMAFGVPVVTHSTMAFQVPEVEAIIPGATGDLFERGSVNDLASVMKPWLERESDRTQSRKACHAMVERFWSPAFQVGAIERAILGYPADDLWFFRNTIPLTDPASR